MCGQRRAADHGEAGRLKTLFVVILSTERRSCRCFCCCSGESTDLGVFAFFVLSARAVHAYARCVPTRTGWLEHMGFALFPRGRPSPWLCFGSATCTLDSAFRSRASDGLLSYPTCCTRFSLQCFASRGFVLLYVLHPRGKLVSHPHLVVLGRIYDAEALACFVPVRAGMS